MQYLKTDFVLSSRMTDLEKIVLEMLVPIFPNLTPDVLEISVGHPSNHGVPLTADTLLQRCIDDLLELRTFTDKTATYRQPAATIPSDGSIPYLRKTRFVSHLQELSFMTEGVLH